MSNNKQDKSVAAFRAKTHNNEQAMTAFCKVQFSAFQTKKQLIIILISLAMIIVGVSDIVGLAASAFLVPVGCFALMYLSYIPKSDAEKLIKAYDGKFPTSIYSFTDKGFDIVSGKDKNHLGYESIIRLIEDDNYLFFFASPQVAYLVDKSSIQPNSLKHFKDYTQKRVGVEWTVTRPWYSINMSVLMKGRKNTKSVKKKK